MMFLVIMSTKLMSSILSEKENTNIIMQSAEKTLSDDEKRQQILKRIESTNSTVLKDVGDDFYFVCVKDSISSLVLYDLVLHFDNLI
mgnify:CR=1 FL=1